MSDPILTRVLVADPPWPFEDKLPGKARGAEKHYTCLPIHEIIRFPLPTLAPSAVLFLWRVASMSEEALAVVRGWGFIPKSEIVWVKTNPDFPAEEEVFSDTPPGGLDERAAMGMGRIVRGSHETCLIATRGRIEPAHKGTRTVFFAPRGEHSAKPDKFYQIVERLFPADPFGAPTELFARRERAGWRCYGNELATAAPASLSAPCTVEGTDKLENNSRDEVDVTTPRHVLLDLVDAIARRGVAVSLDTVLGWSDPVRAVAAAWAEGEDTDMPDVIRAYANRPNGTLPPHVIEELGKHPAILDTASVDRYLARGIADKLIPAGLSRNDAWIKLQYAAPGGWFDQVDASAPTPETIAPQGCAACDKGIPIEPGKEYLHTGQAEGCKKSYADRAADTSEDDAKDKKKAERAAKAAAKKAGKKDPNEGLNGHANGQAANGAAHGWTNGAAGVEQAAVRSPLTWEAAKARAAEGDDPVFEEGFFS